MGLVVLSIVVIIDMGGWFAAWSSIPDSKLRMLPLTQDLPSWLEYLRAWFIIGIANLASQSLLQRGLSARSERVAQKHLRPVLMAIIVGAVLAAIMSSADSALLSA